MYLVLIGGGHSSGKRTFANDLLEKLNTEAESVCSIKVNLIDLADYRREDYLPNIDFERLNVDLDRMERNEIGAAFVFGNYALYNEELCARAQLKVFLDTDADQRLSQWILRDSVKSKCRQLADVLDEYLNKCRSEFENHIVYTKHQADVLLPQGSDPLNVELLATGILEEIYKKDKSIMSSMRSRIGTHQYNLRAEVAHNLETQYYTTA